jgi:GTP-dependent phosphoenolpyruvate carboxykinase
MTKAKTPSKKGKLSFKSVAEHSACADVSNEIAFFECMNKIVEGCDAKGVVLIVGRSTQVNVDDKEDKDAIEKKESSLTTQELSKLRYVVVTENRDKMMKTAQKFASADQQSNKDMVFNTATGNEIILQMSNKIQSAMKKKNLPLRFDTLFALTHALHQYNKWLTDNDMYGEGGQLFVFDLLHLK